MKRKMEKPKTKSQITKREALAFRKRWEIVNAFDKQELRSATADEKLEQLAILMTSAKEFGWTTTFEIETSQVRDRWNKLRKACHA